MAASALEENERRVVELDSGAVKTVSWTELIDFWQNLVPFLEPIQETERPDAGAVLRGDAPAQPCPEHEPETLLPYVRKRARGDDEYR